MGTLNNFSKKLVIITIVVVLCNFLFSNPVSAESKLSKAGGKLIEPICDLLIFARRLYNRCFTN